MTIQEIWETKEKLSKSFWGKSAKDINAMIKPDVDEMKLKIETFRSSKKQKSPN